MKSNISINKLLILLAGISVILLQACSDSTDSSQPEKDAGDYNIYAKFDSIRSYPGGGGILITYIIPDSDFAGSVKLSLEADSILGAGLTMSYFNKYLNETEIVIYPSSETEIRNYNIVLKATHGGIEKNQSFTIHFYDWEKPDSSYAFSLLEQFKSWLTAYNPEYLAIFQSSFKFLYNTYPETLIIEHFTYLLAYFEVRVCHHVMIPPDDWSMVLIRRAGSLQPELAARRDSDGTITQIPVSEYPTLYGY